MRNHLAHFSVVTSLMFSASAYAEEDRAPKIQESVGQPGDASYGTRFHSEFNVKAGDGGSKVMLALTRSSAAPGTGIYNRAVLEVSAPFDSDKQDQTNLGSLSGLTAGANASLQYSLLRWPMFSAADEESAENICKFAFNQLFPGYEWEKFEQDVTFSGGSFVCSGGNLNSAVFKAAMNRIKAKVAACTADATGTNCGSLSGTAVPDLPDNADTILKNASAVHDNFVDAAIKAITTITIGAKINQQKFDYVDAATPTTAQSDKKQGWGVSVAYTRIFQGALWSLGYSHEESYKATDKVDVCSPIPNTMSLRCVNVSIGVPTKKSSEIVFAEYRWSPNATIGISPRLEFDIEDSEWAIGVPIYLVSNADDKLSAGVKFGWDEENDFGIGLFVGKPFSFSSN